ncbi:MAG: hypothetical protein ACKO85_11475 [Isosphaeraceae bacterium]
MSCNTHVNNRLFSKRASILARLLVFALSWWMARLPLAVPDFHEVSHHHSATEPCLLHEHLNRWHGDAQEHGSSTAQAENHGFLLHWHWLLPGNGPMSSETGDESEEGSSPVDPFMNSMFVSNQTDQDSFGWLINSEMPKLACDGAIPNSSSDQKIYLQISEYRLNNPTETICITYVKHNFVIPSFDLDLNIRLRC